MLSPRFVVLGFLAVASATPLPISNTTALTPFPAVADNSSLGPPPSLSNTTLAPVPVISDNGSVTAIPFFSNSTLPGPPPLSSNGTPPSTTPLFSNDTVKPIPTSSNTLILCNDFGLQGPCSYTSLPDFESNCTHVPRLNYSPDSTKFSFVSSIQMPPGYVCDFHSGSDGCIGHGSDRSLRLVGAGYHDCRPDWDNQITYFECVPAY